MLCLPFTVICWPVTFLAWQVRAEPQWILQCLLSLLLFHAYLFFFFVLQRFSLCSWISLFYINSIIKKLVWSFDFIYFLFFSPNSLFFLSSQFPAFHQVDLIDLFHSELWFETQAGSGLIRLTPRFWKIFPVIINGRGRQQDWTEEEAALVQTENVLSLYIHILNSSATLCKLHCKHAWPLARSYLQIRTDWWVH